MSTRIYNGCEIAGHTLESFLKTAQRLRPAMAEVAQQAARQFVMRCAVAHFDRHHLSLAPALPRSFLSHATRRLQERQDEVERSGRRDPLVDFAAEVTLFPLAATRARPARLLAMSFIEHPDVRAHWENQPFWRDFWYGDSGDAPEDVSRRDWAERRRLWARVFPDHRPPSQVGFTLNLLRQVDIYHPMTDALLAPYMPSLDERARGLVDYFMDDTPAAIALPSDATRDVRRKAIHAYLLGQLAPAPDLAQLRAAPPAGTGTAAAPATPD
jgi:hypothetical protein